MLANTYSLNVPVPHVFAKDGRAVTSSLDVAGYFNKPHADVLKSIRRITEDRPKLAEGSFSFGSYADKNNQTRPMYYMDRKGFTLLAFGFTGPRALDFKLAYIDAFEAMEAAVKELAAEKSKQAALSDMDLQNLQAIKHYCRVLQDHHNRIERQWYELKKAQEHIAGVYSMLADLHDMPGELILHMNQLLRRHQLKLK